MTPDEVRGRLSAILSRRSPAQERTCPHCHGSGWIMSAMGKVATQADVAQAIGVSRSQVANFIIRRTDLSFPAGLRLIAWIEEHEAALTATEPAATGELR